MKKVIAKKKDVRFLHAITPIIVLGVIMLYGLVIQPKLFSNNVQLPLELIFMGATIYSVIQLFYLGFSWEEIQAAMVAKLKSGLPAIFVLFCIGLVIGCWVISGTIPMLIYYGIKIIQPSIIYLVAFLVPAVFSTLTGTSWGSAGTIGVVIIGIAGLIDANLAVTAGAIVGGAYFGDKLSPLSDTTNMAAIGAEVDLYEHIKAMFYTTLPAAIMCSIVYFILGFVFPPAVTSVGQNPEILETMAALESIFNFNIFLLIPPIIVLFGALKKKPTVPTLVVSAVTGCILAAMFQRFTVIDIFDTVLNGFKIEMVSWIKDTPVNIITILERGGLYNLISPITITIIVFMFIGSLDLIDALPTVVERTTRFIKTRAQTILATLLCTSLCNALTSNQFATSFIIGASFKYKFDALKIPRKVLSRSMEDAGTMIEGMLPWTTTGVYMATTLGIPVVEYAPYHLLFIFSIIIACGLAITGKGCFYHQIDEEELSTVEM